MIISILKLETDSKMYCLYENNRFALLLIFYLFSRLVAHSGGNSYQLLKIIEEFLVLFIIKVYLFSLPFFTSSCSYISQSSTHSHLSPLLQADPALASKTLESDYKQAHSP